MELVLGDKALSSIMRPPLPHFLSAGARMAGLDNSSVTASGIFALYQIMYLRKLPCLQLFLDDFFSIFFQPTCYPSIRRIHMLPCYSD
ncbi:uncharacterized [Tachysurus ichikawai]